MTYESPVPEWVVGSHGNSQRTSLWLSEVMTNYPDPIHQLVVELNVLSKTSRGRALFSRLQDANVTVPGAISLFEVAQGLEWNPRIEPTPSLVLERLVTLSFRDQDTTLTLLVALRRALREMAFSIGRHRIRRCVARSHISICPKDVETSRSPKCSRSPLGVR